jgi:capsular polysaccharide biosynthesis protein/MinD-like ATPase involved in chromosome partitioning or flagellar assembly
MLFPAADALLVLGRRRRDECGMQQGTTQEEARIGDRPSPREVVTGLRRHLPTIAAIAAVATIAAILASLAQSPRFTSSASVVIETTDSSAPTVKVNMATEKQVASSTTVADAVIRQLGLGGTPEDLLSNLSLNVPVDTEVLVFSYTWTDAREAQHRAQAFADAYLTHRHRQLLESVAASNDLIQERISALEAQLRTLTGKLSSESDLSRRSALQVSANAILSQISIQEQRLASGAGGLSTSGRQLEAASFPTSPSMPRPVVNALLGLFVGIVLGVFAAIGRASLTPRIHTQEDVERAVGAPLLAVIPQSRRAPRGSPIVITGQASPVVDAYRRLVVRLLALPTDQEPVRDGGRTIAVVGLDDASTTAIVAANLGAAMTLSGHVVLLASAARDGGDSDAIFGIPHRVGLSDVIKGEVSLSEAIRPTRIESLGLLPAGSDEGGWILLDRRAVRDAMDEMASTVDMVIVDAPARAATEASALVASCDAVLFVGSFASTSFADARQARKELEILTTSSLGIVMFERRPRYRDARTSVGSLEPSQPWSANAGWVAGERREPWNTKDVPRGAGTPYSR